MSMIIAHNNMAINTQRNLGKANLGMSKSIEKLSSGYRINTGADDPAGLVISEQLRAQQAGLERAVKNTNEAMNVVNIAEGALSEMNDILKKMKQLAIHAASDGITSPSQIEADQKELDSAIQTLKRISDTTRYSDQQLLNGNKELTYTQDTGIKGTQQNKLMNAQASKFDQIYRTNDYNVSINFTGTSNAASATGTGDVDWSKQATKAYFEVDTAVGTLSQVDQNGNVTQEQNFILTGSKGSKSFKFNKGATLTDIVSQIHTNASSTGVDAALVFSSNQSVDMLNASQYTRNIPGTITGVGQVIPATGAAGADIYTGKSMWIGGVTLYQDADKTTVIDDTVLQMEVGIANWTGASKALLSQGAAYGDELGNINDYRFEVFADGDKLKANVYYAAGSGTGSMTEESLLGTVSLNTTAVAGDTAGLYNAVTIGSGDLGGHLDGVTVQLRSLKNDGTAVTTDAGEATLDFSALDPKAASYSVSSSASVRSSVAANQAITTTTDGAGLSVDLSDFLKLTANGVESTSVLLTSSTGITIDHDKIGGVGAFDPDTKYTVKAMTNENGELGLALFEEGATVAVDGSFTRLSTTTTSQTILGTSQIVDFVLETGGALSATQLASSVTMASDPTATQGYAIEFKQDATNTTLTSVANTTAAAITSKINGAITFQLVNAADGTAVTDDKTLLSLLGDSAKAAMGEGDNLVELRFEERVLDSSGDKQKVVSLYVNGSVVGSAALAANAADGTMAVAGEFFYDITQGNGVNLATAFGSNIVNGLGISGTLNANFTDIEQLDWDALVAGGPLMSYTVNKAPSADAGPKSVHFAVAANGSSGSIVTQGNLVGGNGGARAQGTFQVFGNQNHAIRSAGTTGNNGIQGVQFGQNTDGQGRIYVKFTGENTYELYKDSSMSKESLVATGISGKEIIAMNQSGLSGLVLNLDAANTTDEKGNKIDIRSVQGAYIAVGGIEGDNGVSYGGNLLSTAPEASFDQTKTLVSGVELGKNTDVNGKIWTKTVYSGVDSAGNHLVQVFAYNNSLMDDKYMVAKSEVTAVGAKGANVVLNEIRNADNTAGTGLAMSLSFNNNNSLLSLTQGDTIKGDLGFTNLAARVFSTEYGSDAGVKIQQNKGGLFTYYQTAGDQDSKKLIAAEEGSATTFELKGQDATLSVNGSQVQTRGLKLDIATQDLQARLMMNQGKVGSTTLAQVGYDTGSVFTKIGALQLGNKLAEASGTDKYLSGLLCNAGHVTTELITNFQGGMKLQLGEGSGDQERTVISIQSMAISNLGQTVFTDQWDPGKAIYETKTLSMEDVLDGGAASLNSDPLKAMAIIEQAINDVSGLRARLGAVQANMLQTNANNLEVAIENIQKTESAIRDTDMASEMTEFTKNQVLQSASISMLAQANQQSQSVLQLLG